MIVIIRVVSVQCSDISSAEDENQTASDDEVFDSFEVMEKPRIVQRFKPPVSDGAIRELQSQK
jgi:hypothetical protein